jgi:RNA polymerase sigma factor (sigma-70 family)
MRVEMKGVASASLARPLESLFEGGSAVGLGDRELLDRFAARRDGGGEVAFAALVARHGPMVMRVCRNVLDVSCDVHDAFQAVFLVLARRANAIRTRNSVGNWLYGVAVRVSARARVTAIRRQIRERRTLRAAETIATVDSNQNDPSPIEQNEHAEVVHQELSRLPEKYRAPVVLCYLEGLTHDEAAARLSWPVGTVRSRLARARDTLRSRLARRGVTAPVALGPMASWIVGEGPAPPGAGATFASEVITRDLPASIARTVSQLPTGRTAAAGTATSASILLSQGVLKSMMFKKLLIAACTLPPIAITALGGGVFLARKTLAQVEKPTAAPSVPNAPQPTAIEAPLSADVDRLAQQLLEAARRRYDAQRAYYEEGRITIDRFVDAGKQLELAELRIAKTDFDRLAIRQRHLDRIRAIEQREDAELKVGRGTEADVAEARERRLEAEFDLLLSQRETRETTASVLRRLSELERKVEQLQKERAIK